MSTPPWCAQPNRGTPRIPAAVTPTTTTTGSPRPLRPAESLETLPPRSVLRLRPPSRGTCAALTGAPSPGLGSEGMLPPRAITGTAWWKEGARSSVPVPLLHVQGQPARRALLTPTSPLGGYPPAAVSAGAALGAGAQARIARDRLRRRSAPAHARRRPTPTPRGGLVLLASGPRAARGGAARTPARHGLLGVL